MAEGIISPVRAPEEGDATWLFREPGRPGWDIVVRCGLRYVHITTLPLEADGVCQYVIGLWGLWPGACALHPNINTATGLRYMSYACGNMAPMTDDEEQQEAAEIRHSLQGALTLLLMEHGLRTRGIRPHDIRLGGGTI